MIFKKGTILLRKKVLHPKHGKMRQIILPLNEDLIQDEFWKTHSEILDIKSCGTYTFPDNSTLVDLVLSQLHLYKEEDKDEEGVVIEDIK